jgi:pilus assembly protein CpaE
MRAGAREFLELGRLREDLSEVLIKIEAEGGLTGRRGTLVSIYSPSGGVGVSTTAVNLAVRLASRGADQIALVDLKPAPSDLALMLDIEPEHSTDEVCGAWGRLDRKMLEAAMVRHRSGVHVLAQAGFPEDGSLPENTLTKEAVRQIGTLARRSYVVTVADLPHTLDAPVVEAMRLSSIVGLIARPDVPGLRRARWALDAAAAAGVPRDRFRLVLNRFGQSGQVKLSKVEEILGIRVFQRIPEDGGAVNRAVNRGVPLAESSKLSRIGRSFSSFARSVQISS